jgi:hypothetical protein
MAEVADWLWEGSEGGKRGREGGRKEGRKGGGVYTLLWEVGSQGRELVSE